MVCCCQSSTVAVYTKATVAMLLLLLGHTLAVAPGDESDDCEVPDYPDNIRVLLDSWRYQTLLPPENDDTTRTTKLNAIWTTYNAQSHREPVWIAAGGMCGDSAVAVCSRSEGNKVLLIQIIDKSLPAPDEYPVRVFVNISYSFMDCPPGPRQSSNCDREFELQFAEMPGDQVFALRGSDIMPDNHIRDTEIGEMQLYFDLNNNEDEQFRLALVSRSNGACVTVSRVLVYRYECPDNERQSVGLTRRPATQAAINTDIFVTALCAENSNFSESSISDGLLCTTKGTWLNDQTVCECNPGYMIVRDTCSKVPETNPPPTLQQPDGSTVSTSSISPVISSSNIHQASSTIDVKQPPVSESSIFSIRPSNMPTDIGRTTDDSGGIPIAVIAGVGGVAVIIIVLILLVLLLLVVVCVKRNKQKGVSDGDVIYETPGSGDNLHTTENVAYGVTTKSVVTTHNPAYDVVVSKANKAAEDCPGESGMEGSTAATDNGMTHTVHMQSNPVYNLHPSNVQHSDEMEYDYVM